MRRNAALVCLLALTAACSRDPSAITPASDAPTTADANPPSTAATTTASPLGTAPESTTSSHSTTPAPDDPFAQWHAPDGAPLTLADVPLLLPATGVSGPAVRLEDEFSDGEAGEYRQYWASVELGLLAIKTAVGQQIPASGSPVTVPGWDTATLLDTAYPATASVLYLVDAGGTVRLWSNGLTPDELTAVAASLRARTDRAGWDATLPDGFRQIFEGRPASARRTVLWDDVEVSIYGGDTWWHDNSDSEINSVDRIVEIGGTPAAVFSVGALTAVVWSPRPGILVVIGVRRSVDETVALATSITEVTPEQWAQASTVPTEWPSGNCDTIFC